VQPFTGFVPPFEIMRTVRAAGFEPLAPPLREGTTYVLRATDFRGILMRVVIDARTGAIRDANRIVPAGTYGQIEPPPYAPADFDAPELPPPATMEPPSYLRPGPPRPLLSVPLPRPRPATLAARRPAEGTDLAPKATPKAAPAAAPSAKPQSAAKAAASAPTASDPAATGKPDGNTGSDARIKSEITTTVPPAAPSAPKKAPPPLPLND
jgi:hypothetical protein